MLLALDPSTTNLGWALFDGNQYHSSGTFTPPGSTDDRIVAIGRWLENLDWSRITDVAVEVPTGDHANQATDSKLGGVFYLAMYITRTHDATFHRIYPSHIIATGVGKRNLAAATAYIRDATGDQEREVGPDEADALAVALAFLKLERRWTE